MGGELPTYRGDTKLAGCIGVPLALAGLSPLLDCMASVRRDHDCQRKCAFCRHLVPLPWPGNRCPRRGTAYARSELGIVSIPGDWRVLAWDVSANSKKASVIFEMAPTPTVTLLSDSDVLYPTLDRILFSSGCTVAARHLALGTIGFTRLYSIAPAELPAVKFMLARTVGCLIEDRFEPPTASRMLSAALRGHSRPLDGCEVELGPAVNPSSGASLAYVGTWVDGRASASVRSGLLELEESAINSGAAVVDPVYRPHAG